VWVVNGAVGNVHCASVVSVLCRLLHADEPLGPS